MLNVIGMSAFILGIHVFLHFQKTSIVIYSAYALIFDYFWKEELMEEKHWKVKSISQLMKNTAQYTAGILHYLQDRLRLYWNRYSTISLLVAQAG